jgi:acetyl esterase
MTARPAPGAAVEVEDLAVPAGDGGRVELRIVRPAGSEGALPVVLYLGGVEARDGAARADDLAARELAAGFGAAVVLPSGGVAAREQEAAVVPAADLSAAEQEAPLKQAYAVLCWIGREGERRGLDGTRIVLAGDAAGEGLCAALARVVERRGGPPLLAQAFAPAPGDADRDPTAGAPIEQLLGLPSALVIPTHPRERC